MIAVFEKLIENALRNNPECEGDLLNAEGLLCCGVCGEAKRARVTCFGKVYTVPTACSCTVERIEKREASERAAANERRRAEAFADAALRARTFAADDSPGSPASGTAREYSARFDPAASGWLLFHGGCGTGKSFLSCCIANAVIDRGFSAWFTGISAIERILWETKDKSGVFNRIRHCDLLIIDDLSAERQTDYMNGIAFDVIDARLSSGKPAIVTTNLTASDLLKPSSLSANRIYSRILERSAPIQLEGKDRRLRPQAI